MTCPLRRYLFTVRYEHGGPLERLEIVAYDSFEAVRSLPDDLIYWDFAMFPGGSYSLPIDEPAAA